MSDLLEPLKTALSEFGWRDACDIIIMTVVVYALVKVLSKTRAMRVVLGLGVILLFAWIAQLLELSTVVWIFSWVLNASAVFIVILFQPELRRALEKLGRGRIFTADHGDIQDAPVLVAEFEQAILHMARKRVGAILVFERQTGLADLVETGIVTDADVSAQLIETIFYPNNPLHDGAMIIKAGRIWACGCFLPLSDNKQISSELGSRHRASLGVSEVSDAYVLVVSEERGSVSFVYDGTITQAISELRLRRVLESLYMPDGGPRGFLGRRRRPKDVSDDTKEIRTEAIRAAAAKSGQAGGEEPENEEDMKESSGE